VVGLEVTLVVADVVADVVGVDMSHPANVPSTNASMAALTYPAPVEQVLSSINNPELHSTFAVTATVGAANTVTSELILAAVSAQLLLESVPSIEVR
jgi:hypothetical protein